MPDSTNGRVTAARSRNMMLTNRGAPGEAPAICEKRPEDTGRSARASPVTSQRAVECDRARNVGIGRRRPPAERIPLRNVFDRCAHGAFDQHALLV
jgi:hypothetical protein